MTAFPASISPSIDTPPRAPTPRAVADGLIGPLFDTAAESASLLGSRHATPIPGSALVDIPKFMLLGQRGGEKPIRVTVLAGLDPHSTDSIAAFSRLFLQFELNPALAQDYALFGYPIVDAAGFESAAVPALDFEGRAALDFGDGDVEYFKTEFRKWDFDGIITLQTDRFAAGFYAEVRSPVIGREVVVPALAAAARNAPLSAQPVRLLPPGAPAWHSRFSARASSSAEIRPAPFEISLFAPGGASADERVRGLFVASHEILRNYRALVSHAQNL